MSTINITPDSGSKNLAAGVYTSVYTAPSGCVSATVNARIISQNLANNIKTRMAIVPAGWTDGTTAPDSKYWVQPVDLVLGPTGVVAGVLEDTAIVLKPGDSIVMYSDAGSATGRVHGLVRTLVA
jgi:hypothetical protein